MTDKTDEWEVEREAMARRGRGLRQLLRQAHEPLDRLGAATRMNGPLNDRESGVALSPARSGGEGEAAMPSAVRATWSGSVSFGMVQFPVRLYNAASEKTLRFNNIHRECGNKVSGPTVCRPCGGEEITDRADLVKGYEIAKDQMVHLEETDFEALPLTSIKSIEVVATVDPKDVTPQMVSKTYWMGPDDRNKVGDKAFVMFRDALARSDRVAIGRIAMSNKERLAAVTAHGKVLEVSLLFWNDELNGSESVEATIDDIEVSEKEAALADRLMASLEATIEEAYDVQEDAYRSALMVLIDSKLTGAAPVFAAATKTSSADDLMAALEASLDKAA